jgi:hypothetical protein
VLRTDVLYVDHLPGVCVGDGDGGGGVRIREIVKFALVHCACVGLTGCNG